MKRTIRQKGWMWYRWSLVLTVLFIWCVGPVHAATSTTGFLLIAPDRGYLGNQDIRLAFDEFKTSYSPASLVFVGSEYSDYMSRAPHELRQAGAGELVAIPFFLSIADPVLQKVKALLPSYGHLGRSVGLRPWQIVT
jgi:hypothetical protein